MLKLEREYFSDLDMEPNDLEQRSCGFLQQVRQEHDGPR